MAAGIGWGGILRKLKDQWNRRVERTKNYGEKNWSAVGAEQLKRVSEHFQSDLERLKKRGRSQQSCTAVRDYAVLG
jgi:hypothetical protein